MVHLVIHVFRMFPRASEEALSVNGVEPIVSRQETYPTACGISIGDDNSREIEYARVNLEDTNVGIVLTNAAQHCVMRIEIQIRVLVQPPCSWYLFVLANCLNLRHRHRVVS